MKTSYHYENRQVLLKKKKSKFKKILLLFLFAYLFFLIFQLIFSNSSVQASLITPLADSTFSVRSWVSHEIFHQENLHDVVEKAMQNTTGKYSIVIKNLKTGEMYAKDEHRIFDSASLYKPWVMAVVFKDMQNRSVRRDEFLQQDVTKLNETFNIASDSAEMTDGNVSESLMQAVNQMITISHNYSALLLTDRVGVIAVSSFLKTNGFADSSFGSASTGPQTSAADIAAFFEKLYKGEIVSKEASDEMLLILQKQQLNGGLPKYLPENITVAHKTGELGWVKHDAGIVYTPKGNYIIVILSESQNPIGAQERIAQVSKSVYQYFTK